LAPLKDQLLEMIALLEAGIDFAEDDVSVASPDEILRRLDPIEEGVERLASSFAYGQMVHAGITLAIVGRPNVGKSSLFNRLLEQDRAIVTDIPGTTRDLVSEVAAINGIPVKLVDTAGIRQSEGLVETLGIERSFQAMADADLTLVVIDLSLPVEPGDRDLIDRAKSHGRWLVAGNKCDLPRLAQTPERMVPVSALTGARIEALRAAIFEKVAPRASTIRSRASSPACVTHNSSATPWNSCARRVRQSWITFRTRCCCWICMAHCGPSTRLPAPPRPTTS